MRPAATASAASPGGRVQRRRSDERASLDGDKTPSAVVPEDRKQPG